ncbi:CHC2 zinc finger domain-containing protein [Salinisphaera orenii]|uniref:CHC2 zinc finger domain-containing protein n=1 Tax=Salinisphaera orenii TaxID=856731 RepID=UPI0013A60925
MQRTGKDQWLACCPAHADRTPSLSIRETDDNTLLLHCFAACTAAEVVHGVGLEVRDLFPYQMRDHKPIPSRQRWDHQALLKALRREADAVVISANQLANNRPLAEPDRQRLMQAARRIERIVEVAE